MSLDGATTPPEETQCTKHDLPLIIYSFSVAFSALEDSSLINANRLFKRVPINGFSSVLPNLYNMVSFTANDEYECWLFESKVAYKGWSSFFKNKSRSTVIAAYVCNT